MEKFVFALILSSALGKDDVTMTVHFQLDNTIVARKAVFSIDNKEVFKVGNQQYMFCDDLLRQKLALTNGEEIERTRQLEINKDGITYFFEKRHIVKDIVEVHNQETKTMTFEALTPYHNYATFQVGKLPDSKYDGALWWHVQYDNLLELTTANP